MSRQQLKEKGFTIIEVVLVLAIAALIFLMVFIALPALQRNQRDQDRKVYVGKVVSAISTYQSTNRGESPENGAALADYVDGVVDEGNAKLGGAYTLIIQDMPEEATLGAADKGTIQVYKSAQCGKGDDLNKAVSADSSRQAAVIIQLENGNAFFCQDA